MRSIIAAYFFVTLIVLIWAVQTPVGAAWNVRVLSGADFNSADAIQAEDALIRLGPGAVAMLQRGMAGDNVNSRLHCAKVLIMLGDNDGETFLLAQLRAHTDPKDAVGRKIEMLLLSAWDKRDGPSEPFRQRLNAVENTPGHVPETLQAFKDILSHYPYWADGYARRAKLYQQSGEVFEAKRDALTALTLAPNHFEALVTLGKVQLAVEAPQHAYKCFQRALMVNPLLKDSLKDDIRDTLKALDLEKAKYRDEKRRNATLA